MAASIGMSSFTIAPAAPKRRSFATFATKGTTSVKEQGFFEWLGGALNRDHLLETDPLLKKVEDKSPVVAKKTVNSAAVEKNSGGFGGLGGLFAKK